MIMMKSKMKPLPLLLLLAIATLTTCLLAADVDAAPTPPPARRRFLRSEEENDATYDAILAMHNATFDHECYVTLIDGMSTVSSSTTPSSYPVVWCDISGLPLGLNVTAEIRDGTCDEFSDAASSEYFTKGVASPILLPEVTEEEKRRGTFDHSYCAGMDVLYDVEGTGELVSVVRARFAMEVTFGYEEEEIHEGGEGDGGEEDEVVVEERLTSVKLVDENTKVKEEQMELRIGLGVLAGATITLALIAIIYGEKKKKKARTRRRWEAYQRNLEMDDEEHDIEIARIKEDAAPGGEDEIFKIASVDENEII